MSRKAGKDPEPEAIKLPSGRIRGAGVFGDKSPGLQ